MHLMIARRIFSCYYFILEVEVPIRRDSLDGQKRAIATTAKMKKEEKCNVSSYFYFTNIFYLIFVTYSDL